MVSIVKIGSYCIRILVEGKTIEFIENGSKLTNEVHKNCII